MAATGSPGQGRTQAAALQATARRRLARILRPSRQAQPPAHLAVGIRAPRRAIRNSRRSSPLPADTAGRRPHRRQQTAGHRPRSRLPANTGETSARGPVEPVQISPPPPKTATATSDHRPCAPRVPLSRLLHVPGERPREMSVRMSDGRETAVPINQDESDVGPGG